jgi:molecular chaperone GrpE
MEGDSVTEMENNNQNEEQVTMENSEEEVKVDTESTNSTSSEEKADSDLEKKLAEKQKECDDYLELLRRTKAEFDNYRKRTSKEKEALYDDGFADAMKEILPVLDNLERALSFSNSSSDGLFEGVQMVTKMFIDSLAKVGVEEIKAEGQKFDPNYHNAVMHVEDESVEENIIVDVLQKGYKYKEKVIRYSMVKVAN